MLLWFAIISLLPLAALLFFANQYNQRVYLAEVDREMQAELRRLAASIEQQFHQQRNILDSLADAEVVTQFARELEWVITRGSVTWEYAAARARVERFLFNLQPVVAEKAAIRILDHRGNTVVQANYGGLTKPELESLLPYPLLEVEPEPGFSRKLEALPDDEISYLRFPHGSTPSGETVESSILDAFWPLELAGHRIYLVFSSAGERFDRLFALTPRLRGGKIGVVENDADRTMVARWIFNDTPTLAFSSHPATLTALPPPVLSFIGRGEDKAIVRGEHFRWFMTEYFPYPDRLLSWVLSIRLNNEKLTGQFKVVSYGLLALTVVMLLLGFLLARLASRRLAKPITHLARNMRNYANGVPMTAPVRSWSSEVNELDRSFQQMITSLEQAEQLRNKAEKRLIKSARLASIGEMAAGIGHELNNPLTNILSLGKLIKRSASGEPEIAEDAEAILAETRRAEHIVKGILNFARQISPVYEQIDVREWLERCVQRMAGKLVEQQVTVEIKVDEELVVQADRYQMEQVMLNLLQNAIHASPQGSVIRIVASVLSGWLVIRVIDQGSGIDADVEDRLFEPFATSKPVGEGSGLGLSISLGIVEMHGGHLQLKNNDDGGCTAEISIPLVKE